MLNKQEDPLFVDAGKIVIEKDHGSIGLLQRYFKIDFNRAERIMLQLFEAGVVGEENDFTPRKVLMSIEQFENYLQAGSLTHHSHDNADCDKKNTESEIDFMDAFTNDKNVLSVLENIIVPQSNGTIQTELIDNIIENTSCQTTKLILIDDSIINFHGYQDARHLYIPLISNMEKVTILLDWVYAEVNERAHLFADVNARDIFTYNKLASDNGLQVLPIVVIIVNEFYNMPTASEKNLMHLLLDSGHRGIFFIAFSKLSLKHLSLGAKEDLLNVYTAEQLQQSFAIRKTSNRITHN